MAEQRNAPTPEGREIGAELARMCDTEAACNGKPDTRCKSCAFKAGTFPNGCLETVMDAIKCTMEAEPFFCHEHFDKEGNPTELCGGFDMMMSAKTKPTKVAWKFSHEYAEEDKTAKDSN